MSNKEKCIAILDSFDDEQLENIANMLQEVKQRMDKADDEFCEQLYKRYLEDDEKGEFITIEEAAKQMDVTL